MTRVRKLALGISARVVRWASPGCKEWAEGLAREAAVIDSDWAALRWAIGSTRVLLDRRQVPLISLDEVPDLLLKHVDYTRSGYGLWVLILQGPFYATRIFIDHLNGLQRTGCILVVLGSIVAGSSWLMGRRRLKLRWYDDFYDDTVACARLYQAEQRRIPARLFFLLLSLLCTAVGIPLSYRNGFEPSTLWGMAGVFFLAMQPLLIQAQRNSRRRIEQINALLAERGLSETEL